MLINKIVDKITIELKLIDSELYCKKIYKEVNIL